MNTLVKNLITRAARTWKGHKTQAQLSLCLCGVLENLNLSGLDLRSVDWESTYTVSRGKPSAAKTLRALPTHASGTCLRCSSLPTVQLNK